MAGVPRSQVVPSPSPTSVHTPTYRWRAGIEGRISVLKRRFGLARCRYHGEEGVERWVGWGLLAHNLRQIGRSVAADSPV